jgi:enoyl-CoA hydratase/carnithine racemase
MAHSANAPGVGDPGVSEHPRSASRIDTSAGPPVVVTRPEAGVLVLTLDRPDVRNSLSVAMMDALAAALAEASADRNVRAIVIAATGPAFCAGHDLKELTAHRTDEDRGQAFYARAMDRCASLMQAIIRCPKPVIAAVHATATAAGCQLVATCDLAVAAETARFCTPGVNIGLFCSTPMVALSRNVPRKRAMEMLLLGDLISAADAADWGLVNRIVPGGRAEVMEAALDLARRIAAKSASTVATGKEAFYVQAEMDVASAYRYAADVMVRNMLAHDAVEGIGAFLDKRPPMWTDQ